MTLLLGLAACGDSPRPVTSSQANTPVPHGLDPARVARGAVVYQKYCTACHGPRAEGAPNWHKPGPDGKYPPPALNGTAHSWHHPTASLKYVILNGTQRIGGNMPPWRGKLTENDAEDVIAWFQSLWPAEIYRAWADNDRRAVLRGTNK